MGWNLELVGTHHDCDQSRACPAWFCVMKEEYERDKVEINDLNNLIENLLKLEKKV